MHGGPGGQAKPAPDLPAADPAGPIWDTLDARCRAWDVQPLGPLPQSAHCGVTAVVIPGFRHGQRVAVKVLRPLWRDSCLPEAAALASWDGAGAARLIDHDSGSASLLLEWLDGPAASGLEAVEVAGLCGRLAAELAVPPPPGVTPMTQVTQPLSHDLPVLWARLGQPVPAKLVQQAAETMSQAPLGWAVLVHGDLHPGNLRRDGAGRWRAFDPRPMAGDPSWGVTEAYNSWTPGRGREMVAAFSAEGGFDPGHVRAWLVARLVAELLAGLVAGHTVDPPWYRAVLADIDA